MKYFYPLIKCKKIRSKLTRPAITHPIPLVDTEMLLLNYKKHGLTENIIETNDA